ncbi:MAG: helix-turn-helix transcriptional regulator [Microcystis sp. M54BS1]|uniref:response regulator transcription factor n=1 Tax=unclassified Microcystis TaxID=2643300 RepID=UPI0025798DDD|nr:MULTISPECIES: helix-turn-helix transcriptional regulator [unclassified Microcystis]MCA2541484.1 helix-turn-helix transcriptional regulator [Microcystis sp. M54BS1]MCA2594933.1 helix-turn-helix transcriptional regulator [Microcystis sp. M38BS1]MCA2611893.1 helix-turn-helix transcriptional regulator [Microcystis sp. M27BS1]MCA2505429.1 helix-turn-helix transcriptional regulator [Microcystis sp. M62BS1]MCA2509217.1 helix-turn-helix transcriptional regulator [Microcystis sp. M60BS1]
MDNQSDFLRTWDDLTLREKEILSFIVEGKSDKEIAKKLDLSVRTVTNHVYHILKKFGKQSRASLIAYYYRDSGYLIIKNGGQYGICKTA